MTCDCSISHVTDLQLPCNLAEFSQAVIVSPPQWDVIYLNWQMLRATLLVIGACCGQLKKFLFVRVQHTPYKTNLRWSSTNCWSAFGWFIKSDHIHEYASYAAKMLLEATSASFLAKKCYSLMFWPHRTYKAMPERWCQNWFPTKGLKLRRVQPVGGPFGKLRLVPSTGS